MSIAAIAEIVLYGLFVVHGVRLAQRIESMADKLVNARAAEADMRRCGSRLAARANLAAARVYLAVTAPLEAQVWVRAERAALQHLAIDREEGSCKVWHGVTTSLHYEQNPALPPAYPNWTARLVRVSQ